jgi:hypothetical protein
MLEETLKVVEAREVVPMERVLRVSLPVFQVRRLRVSARILRCRTVCPFYSFLLGSCPLLPPVAMLRISCLSTAPVAMLLTSLRELGVLDQCKSLTLSVIPSSAQIAHSLVHHASPPVPNLGKVISSAPLKTLLGFKRALPLG